MRYKIFISCLYELAGTALLVFIGLSVVIFINGEGSFIKSLIPSAEARRYITGFLFGSTGCVITLSPVGKVSGAHINPTVSLAFYLKGKMKIDHAVAYIISQVTGAVIGAMPLLLWREQGASIDYGATLTGDDGVWWAFIGEMITSFFLVASIFFFTGHKLLRRFTPYMIPFLFCIMVGVEGAVSGTSTNAARSFGPAVIANIWSSHWIYWTAPFAGSILAVLFFNTTWAKRRFHVIEARLAYFHQHFFIHTKTI